MRRSTDFEIALDEDSRSQELHDNGRHIKVQGQEQLPSYQSILNAKDGEIQTTDACRKIALAVLIGPQKAAIILNGDTAASKTEYKSLRSILRHGKYAVEATYVVQQDIFSRIHATAGVELKDDEGFTIHESAQSHKNFELILEEGIKAGASDIHVCVRENGATVLIRVYGILTPVLNMGREEAIEAVGVAYNKMAIESSRSRTAPQFNPRMKLYCMIDRVIGGKRWRLRYQSSNMEGGFDVVMRILSAEPIVDSKSLSELGYEASQQEQLRLAMMRSVGAVFVAGETGSGKSTTLMTLMTMDPERGRHKWYSVEDPVEYRMHGVSQIPVQRDTADEDSMPFIEAFRALLRMDPNVMMIGEIRDKETAELFAPAVMSGHRCLTTVHAPSGIGIIGRLSSAPIMMPRSILAGKRFISALVYQSLVPTLCPHCKKPASNVLDEEYLSYIEQKFEISTAGMFSASNQNCGHKGCVKGIAGQTVAAEVIIPDSHTLILLRDGLDAEAELRWRQTRISGFDHPDMTGKTSFEHALYKCTQGIVDPRDIETTFESFKTYEIVTR